MATMNRWIRHSYALPTWECIGRGCLGFGWLLLICSWPLISVCFNKPLSDIVFLFVMYPYSAQLVIESIKGTVSFDLDSELPIARKAIVHATSNFTEPAAF